MFSEEIIKFYTARSSAEHPTEQGYEGTHIVISQIQRYRRHWLAGSQKLKSPE